MLAEPMLNYRDEILQIAARHGAYNVRVFGSQARGEAKQDSDLDLLVEVGPNRRGAFKFIFASSRVKPPNAASPCGYLWAS